MKQIDVGIIGTGWCGGIRAVACARSALVGQLHLVETDADRLREISAATSPASAPPTGRRSSPTTPSTR